MTAQRLGRVQRLARALLPARIFAAVEAESRQWRMECPRCGLETSVWDRGGIRYKASGTPRRLMRCARCGDSGWHSIRRTEGA